MTTPTRTAATTPEVDPPPAPDEYARRLESRRESLDRQARLELRIADARLAVFTLGLVALALALAYRPDAWAWSLAPFAGFVALVVAHERVRRATRRAARAADFYERGLKRFDGSWPGTGLTGERFLDLEHPYAADLDLFGRGSLFERLCTARTRAGEETLAAWLLAPAEPATVRARQEAVDELRPRLELREDLELLGADVREGIDPESLAAWGKSARVFTARSTAVTAHALAVLAIASLIAWAATDVGTIPLFLVIIVEFGFAFRNKRNVRGVLHAIERRGHDLVLLSGLLARLERESFRSPELTRLRESLRTAGDPASHRIARLARLLHLLDTGHNQMFAPFAALMLWTTHLAMAIDAWRARTGPEIAGWLASVGQFEALSALSAYAYENPDDPFPEIEERDTCFEAESVGHPLISQAACVRNDVRLGGELRVLLVSGSNMSGKSTLLRTVGANTVLALAGGPVRARRLRVSVLAVGATLRIQDSLQAGRSRFYAEITRVRLLVDLSRGPRPLLFLLDEVFHGTNSHDRTVGAGAVVRGLIDRGAIGLVTTHDLALAEFADRLAPRAENVHFEDQLVDGTMRFDYRMRPGVVRHSNALALMRAVGLDV
ncbi:MAG: DNA mismatch repair protein MutS [Planctomycetia bacterium]|nr:DNA mismatch repair protein MutS [Planctomycetia bacterium]